MNPTREPRDGADRKWAAGAAVTVPELWSQLVKIPGGEIRQLVSPEVAATVVSCDSEEGILEAEGRSINRCKQNYAPRRRSCAAGADGF